MAGRGQDSTCEQENQYQIRNTGGSCGGGYCSDDRTRGNTSTGDDHVCPGCDNQVCDNGRHVV